MQLIILQILIITICEDLQRMHKKTISFFDNWYYPSKHFLFSKRPSRRLDDVFSVTLFVFQDVLKTSWRRLQDIFAIRLPKTSSRRLQDVFARRLAIMSSRRLQDVLEDKEMLHWRRVQYVFTKTNVCWDVTCT